MCPNLCFHIGIEGSFVTHSLRSIRFNIHWTLGTDSITIALEFADAPNNTRWVGFGWGSRMDTADAWIAQGPNFNNLYACTGDSFSVNPLKLLSLSVES